MCTVFIFSDNIYFFGSNDITLQNIVWSGASKSCDITIKSSDVFSIETPDDTIIVRSVDKLNSLGLKNALFIACGKDPEDALTPKEAEVLIANSLTIGIKRRKF